MFKKYLNSQKGFGFADVLGASVIVTISLAALFMIIFSSKIRVTNDYHYRKALLGALSNMEIVKYYNDSEEFTGNLFLGISGLENNIVLDESYTHALTGEVKINIHNKTGLIEISPYAARKELTVKVEWTEKSSSILQLFKPRTKNVVLREDYYYELTQ